MNKPSDSPNNGTRPRHRQGNRPRPRAAVPYAPTRAREADLVRPLLGGARPERQCHRSGRALPLEVAELLE